MTRNHQNKYKKKVKTCCLKETQFKYKDKIKL